MGGGGETIALEVKPDWRTPMTAFAGIMSVLMVAAGLFYTNAAIRQQREATRQQQEATLQGQLLDLD